MPESGRITPALAGNTQLQLLDYAGPQDHPRTRGEHYDLQVREQQDLGSPPHSRGTLSFHPSIVIFIRITPALAGNTTFVVTSFLWFKDHPRTRGEHTELFPRASTELGSPPHSRGTLFSTSFIILSARITPALAGNTLVLSLP